jgi:hypothetical protein
MTVKIATGLPSEPKNFLTYYTAVMKNDRMRVYQEHELDTTLDFQLVDCGGGLLQVYALGEKTGSFVIGEVAIKNIANKIEYLTDDRAQRLVQKYCQNATQARAEQIKNDGPRVYPKLRLF